MLSHLFHHTLNRILNVVFTENWQFRPTLIFQGIKNYRPWNVLPCNVPAEAERVKLYNTFSPLLQVQGDSSLGPALYTA